MAGASGNSGQFDPHSYLSSSQSDLLFSALSSTMKANEVQKNNQYSTSNPDVSSMNMQHFDGLGGVNGGTLDPSFFASPQPSGSLPAFDSFGVDDSPYIDFADSEHQFDFDDLDNGDDMIGPIPGEVDADGKRKSPEDGQTEYENGGKRQEGEDKTAKKPGRKPLTSEPTTKRKAQNRAAQRAFRERKEKHLKDLETKVLELEKQSESEKHENGLLRAQVERLQTELREYRKRLSLNSNRISGSPPVGGYSGFLANLANQSNGGSSNNFQFDFPRFGNLPGAHTFNNASPKNKPEPVRSNSTPTVGASGSPKTQPASTLNGAKPSESRDRANTESSAGSRVFRFNSNSTPSNSHSPSASSNSQFSGAANSSCGTSPEPSNNSPEKEANLDTVNEKGYICHGNSEGEIIFCEKLNMACGNPRNPVPRAKSEPNVNGALASGGTLAATAPAADMAGVESTNGIDWMATQNGGQFDPALFGDYRESNAAIVGDGDFTGGFFNDAFAMPDFGASPFNASPFNAVETPAIQKSNPLEEIEKLQDDGDDEVVPADDMSRMLSCHKIWDKLQQNPEFKEGTFDIDGLCSELRAKARCSETGVVVDQKDVDAALNRFPQQNRA